MPLGQLWPTGPRYSLYTAYVQPIYRVLFVWQIPVVWYKIPVAWYKIPVVWYR